MIGTPDSSPRAQPIENMRITIWGVQGSFPVAADGGDTTCVLVETSEGNDIILDAGSGIRRCSLDLVRRRRHRADRQIHLFGSHEHLDHRSGLAFSKFCYVDDPPYTISVYGGHAFLRTLDDRYGIFSRQAGSGTHLDDPIDFSHMKATFIGTEIRPGGDAARPERHWNVQGLSPIHIGRTIITPFEVYHTVPLCLGYRIEHDGHTFVFATDHERRRGEDPTDQRQIRSETAEAMVVEMSRHADLAYYDAQYLLEEYLGRRQLGDYPAMPRIDWGHSCVEDVVARAMTAGVKQTLIGHHDPDRDRAARIEIDSRLAAQCTGQTCRLQVAEANQVFDL